MNSKAAIDDWRIVVIYPLLALIDILLKVWTGFQAKNWDRSVEVPHISRLLCLQSQLARWLFDKYRTPENIKNILSKVRQG